MKRKIKILIDIIMFFIFIYLMSYRAGRGLFLHGVFGCVLFALFIIHHLLNIRWYFGLNKGKYNWTRKSFAIIDFILLTDMILMAISSVMMSGNVFSFSPFISTQFARDLHVSSTAWGFIFTALHLGLHTNSAFKKLIRIIKETNKKYLIYIYNFLFFIFLALGVFFFIKSELWKSMFMIPKNIFNSNIIIFYIEYSIITLSICQAFYLFENFANAKK